MSLGPLNSCPCCCSPSLVNHFSQLFLEFSQFLLLRTTTKGKKNSSSGLHHAFEVGCTSTSWSSFSGLFSLSLSLSLSLYFFLKLSPQNSKKEEAVIVTECLFRTKVMK